VVLILVAFALVIGGLAAGTAFYFYDKATAIDRSTPLVVTRSFLDATLVKKDAAKTALFVCDGWSANAALALAGAPTDPTVVIWWGDSSISESGNQATTVTQVHFAVHVAGGQQEEVDTWTLHLEKQDGWRVCSLSKEKSSL
jgi:hypothetical protein